MSISEMKTDLSSLGDFSHLEIKMQAAKDQHNYLSVHVLEHRELIL